MDVPLTRSDKGRMGAVMATLCLSLLLPYDEAIVAMEVRLCRTINSHNATFAFSPSPPFMPYASYPSHRSPLFPAQLLPFTHAFQATKKPPVITAAIITTISNPGPSLIMPPWSSLALTRSQLFSLIWSNFLSVPLLSSAPVFTLLTLDYNLSLHHQLLL
jgi:hypothetical protein